MRVDVVFDDMSQHSALQASFLLATTAPLHISIALMQCCRPSMMIKSNSEFVWCCELPYMLRHCAHTPKIQLIWEEQE